MLNQRVEELPLPGHVARQAGHHPSQRTVSLPASREREVMVRHGQQFSGVQAVVYPVFIDQLVVPLLGLAAPQYRDYQIVQHSGEVGVDDVPGGLGDPVSEILRGLLVEPSDVELFTRQKGKDLTDILWRERGGVIPRPTLV